MTLSVSTWGRLTRAEREVRHLPAPPPAPTDSPPRRTPQALAPLAEMSIPTGALFVTAVYDIYSDDAGSPASSRTDAIWERLAAITPGLPWLHIFTDRDASSALPRGSDITVELLPLTATATFHALAHVSELPPIRTPGKDTERYLKLQCAKAELLRRAVDRHPAAGAVIWIDAGIAKIIPGAPDPAATVRALACQASALVGDGDVATVRTPTLIAPGCWSLQPVIAAAQADSVRWRFCGGLCFVPRALAAPFEAEVLAAAIAIAAATGRLTWEVNVWELVENSGAVPFEWHSADHDASMLDCLRQAVQHRARCIV